MLRTSTALILAGLTAGVFAKSEVFIYRSDSTVIIQPAPTIDSIIFTAGLLAFYPFNGNALDKSGNNSTGLSYTAVLTTDRFGDTNSAYLFNGTNNNFFIPGIKLSNDFTITAWVRTEGSTDYQGIAGGVDSSAKKGWELFLTPANKIGIEFGDGGSGSWPHGRLISASTLSSNEWHFVAAVRRGTTLKVYLDGEINASGSCGSGTISNLVFYEVGGGLARSFRGKIDQIRIYGNSLRDDQISGLFRECRIELPMK